jgi:hypothetical protein
LSATLLNRISRIFPRISIAYSIFLATLALAPIVHAQNTDYYFGATPMNLCVNPGVNGVSVISVASGTFRGTINLAYGVDALVSNGPILSGNPSSVTLTGGETVGFSLTMSTTTNTPTRLYYVTVSDSLDTHRITVELNVNHSCSVGGTIVPVDRLGLVAPFTNIVLSTIAILGVVSALSLFVGRHRRGSIRQE